MPGGGWVGGRGPNIESKKLNIPHTHFKSLSLCLSFSLGWGGVLVLDLGAHEA